MKTYVKIIGEGTEDAPYRPDIPPSVEWETVGLPSRLDKTDRRGEPVCNYALVEIADEDALTVNTLPPEQVDETTKLLTAVMQAARDPEAVESMADKDNDDTPKASFGGAQKERHRNKIDNSIIHRRRWARLLVRLCRRGFPAEKAKQIANKHEIDRDLSIK